MMITSHGAAAMLAAVTHAKLKGDGIRLTAGHLGRMFLFGVLPDLPLTTLVLLGKFDPATDYHHRWLTHTPIFWLIVSLLVMKLVRPRVGLELLLGTWLHLAMDWYGGADGIPFLYPLTDRQYGVDLSTVNGPEGIRLYLSHPVYLVLEVFLQLSLVTIVVTRLTRARRNRAVAR